MQIGNSRPIGPNPNEPNKPHLDPDLTRVNREGVEYTQEVQRKRTSAAQDEAVENQETARVEREATDRSRVAGNDLSRETVELSTESRRLVAEELPGPGGRSESTEVREARVEELREAHKRGDLNSPERMREAANRLLGGD